MKSLTLLFLSLLGCLTLSAQAQCGDTCKVRLDTAQDLLTVLGVGFQQTISRESKLELLEKLTAWQAGEGAQTEKPTTVEGFREYPRLTPDWKERVARMPSFKAEIVKTLPNVYGIAENAPAGTLAAVIPNPDHLLLNLGGSLDISELFLNVANRVSLCQSRIDTQDPKMNEKTGNPNDKCRQASYLKAGRWYDPIERYVSASVINVNVSQIPNYQSGILLLPQAPEAQQRWTYTVTGSIIPTSLFHSASDLKAVAAYAATNQKLVDLSTILPAAECDDALHSSSMRTGKPIVITKECLTRIAIGSKSQRALLTVLPRVDVKAYTALDFTKNGTAAFVQLPGGDKPLYDITFTWDMHNLFPSTQNRADALAAIRSIQQADKKAGAPKKPVKEEPLNIRLWKQNVASLYCVLANKVEMSNDEAFWQHFIQVVTTLPIDPPDKHS